jgi:hypothetical protein
VTVNPKCPDRVTRQGSHSATGVPGAPVVARTEFHRGHRSTLEHGAWHAALAADASAVEEGTSLATWRWCQSMGCRRMPTWGGGGLLSPFLLPLPFPLLLLPLLGLGKEGGGLLESSPCAVGVGEVVVVAAGGALHLRAQSRRQRHAPGLPSCPAQSPRF